MIPEKDKTELNMRIPNYSRRESRHCPSPLTLLSKRITTRPLLPALISTNCCFRALVWKDSDDHDPLTQAKSMIWNH